MEGNRAGGEVADSTTVGSVEEEDTLVQADVLVISGDQRANKDHDSAAIFTGDCCIGNIFICINTRLNIASGIPGGGGGERLVHRQFKPPDTGWYGEDQVSHSLDEGTIL